MIIPPSGLLPTGGHCASVDAEDDTVLEGDHSFTVAISAISNHDVVAGAVSSIEVRINDNEGIAC